MALLEVSEPEPRIPRIYTLRQAADHLCVNTPWLSYQLREGRYAGLKASNRWANDRAASARRDEAMTRPVKEPEPEPEGYPGG